MSRSKGSQKLSTHAVSPKLNDEQTSTEASVSLGLVDVPPLLHSAPPTITPLPKPPPPHIDNSGNFAFTLLIASVVIFAIVVKFHDQRLNEEPPSVVDPVAPAGKPSLESNSEYRAKVNEYLQSLDRDRELRRQRGDVDALYTEPIGTLPSDPPSLNNPVGFDFRQDPEEGRLKSDVYKPSQVPHPQRDIDEQINQRLRQQQQDVEYEQMARREYIRDLRERAEKAGVQVEIDEKNETIEFSPQNK